MQGKVRSSQVLIYLIIVLDVFFPLEFESAKLTPPIKTWVIRVIPVDFYRLSSVETV